jgi:YfiH family protein
MPLDPFRTKNLISQKIQHGFFTRNGGVSEGLYESLNCARSTKGDLQQNVEHNRQLVAQHLKVTPENLITMKQVHSATAVLVEGENTSPVEADAMVTTQTGLALGILTADCTPVLFHDAKAGVIGAAHAGWRGAVDGVLQATIDLMCAHGASPETISVGIGPTIQQKNYEVDQNFFERLLEMYADNSRFFLPSTREQHFLFDLPGFVQKTLQDCGITDIEISPHCTYEKEDQFFSYRRNTHQSLSDYGRQISAIVLNKS